MNRDVVKYGVVKCDVMWYSVVCYDVLWYSVVCYDVLWYRVLCCVVLCCVVFKEGDTIYVMLCSMVLRGVYVCDFPNDVDLCGVL